MAVVSTSVGSTANSTTNPKQPAKRYICSFCARTFSRSEHKLRHERSHTKEKPFDCKICSSAFVRRDLLQRHCRTVHGVIIKTNNQQHSLVNNGSTNNSNGNGNANHRTSISSNSSTGSSELLDDQQLLQQRQLLPKTAQDVDSSSYTQQLQQDQQQQPQIQTQMQTQTQHHHHHQPQQQQQQHASMLSEKNIISLLSLCKKFNYLTIPYELDNAICNYFLTYGTRCHNILPLIKFDRILNLNENDELLFIILCIGANENNNLLDSIKLFNKSWSIINDKINNHKIDYNSENIDEFVESVIMLSYIYLNYFDNYFDQNLLSQNISVEIDVLFEYLTSVIVTQILNEGRHLSNGTSLSIEELCKRQFPVKLNYWHAHVLLAQFAFIYNKPPTILHSFLLNKRLPVEDNVDHNCTMAEMLKNLTVSSSLNQTRIGGSEPAGSKLFRKLGLVDNIIIASLMNELLVVKQKNHDFTAPYATPINTFYDDNKNFLHNSIILANKSFNHGYDDEDVQQQQQQQQQQQAPSTSTSQDSPSQQAASSSLHHHHHNQYNMNQPIGLLNDGVDNLTVFSRNHHAGNWTVSNRSINNLPYIQFLNMLIMCKRKMLINCPLKFIDLITNYVFLPKDQANWALLNLTLKEFNNDNNSNKFDGQGEISSKFFELRHFIDLSDLSGVELSADQISQNINAYINCLYPSSFVINNNLGISTLPVLYLALNNVNNNLVNFKSFLSLPSNKQLTVGFIVEAFLTLIRILVNYRYRLFNMKSPNPRGNGAYNSNNMLITSPEGFLENSILSVILYFMDQCGSNVLSKLPIQKQVSNTMPSGGSQRPRSNSISIGEFDHNNERFKFSLLDKFVDDPKVSPEYPPLVKILSNDFKYYYYLKNLENGLVNWLNVFIIDPAIMTNDNLEHLLRYRNFIAGLKSSLTKIYDQLDLTADPLPIPTKISSPELKPRSNFNELDFQQQQLQQQSFTGLLNSHSQGYHNDLLHFQKHNVPLHVPAFTQDRDADARQRQHSAPASAAVALPQTQPQPPTHQHSASTSTSHASSSTPVSTAVQPGNSNPSQQQPQQQKIILPPIVSAQPVSPPINDSNFAYPATRPTIMASKFGLK